MSDINFLIASWKAQRALLSNQLEILERDEVQFGADGIDITQLEIARLKSWIAELDELLAEYERSQCAARDVLRSTGDLDPV